ncbi:MAG: pantetheine-phosphate adenylyltransferase [Flavobacteriia bacterium]|jgi:pantetheine-phosphate adenylyltransferase
MKRIGLFPGSFDPFTKGHEAVARKALELFDEIIIAIGTNSSKTYQFELSKRMNHIQSLFEKDAIRIVTYQKLTVDLCKDIGASHIVRGLRDSKDFEYERSIAQMNNQLSGIETVFFLTDPEYAAINATIVREIYKNNGDISHFVTNNHLLV